MAGESINDLIYKYYSAVVTGESSLFGAINVSQAAIGVSATDSVCASGSVNAPGAGVDVAKITALPAGTYNIRITAAITGTTVAALEADNMVLVKGAAEIVRVLVPVPGTAGGVGNGEVTIRAKLTVATDIIVEAKAAATAGSVYKATIVANQIGF